MHDSHLEGRTAVVTGAARGVGAALARELARRGARLALIGHEGAALRSVAASLPTPAMAVEADVTDGEALERAAEAVRTRLGPPSVVVANAGIAEAGPFASADMASWRRVVDVNVTGSALTARAFLPDLTESAGYYLQIASLASIGAAPLMSAYCASKAGVEAFAHTLGAETAHHGVAVGIAYLNWTDTDMIRDGDRHGVLRELRARMPPPARRVLPPEFVATRLATAVERRRTAVYVPASLRLVQVARAAVPSLVLRRTRRALPRLEASEPLRPTGLLGAGGRADEAAAARRGHPPDGR
ncbi:NAD(P)-dependent dehydrogenase (short-subunit alcohol dehydrogenase family) [Streptomyces sp. 3330]|uniref:SDR family oxidoreductase n=1 Tax=Streptomyces sp. 3330 TaxID=2817755 RepID=UPI00286709AA|nr:SDR family oxidoreductase [Streptomyces sp. 3330]MDR6979603.1 NAD(P)-dependent dehydrogenase (short-subunit alcohol dehydrogenase family) [Streptomyces sp. 3330]